MVLEKEDTVLERKAMVLQNAKIAQGKKSILVTTVFHNIGLI